MAKSATVRVKGPAVSKGELSGTIPFVDQRPAVGLIPTFPVIEAGIRTDPAVSLPIANMADRSPKLTPAPELEPPGDL